MRFDLPQAAQDENGSRIVYFQITPETAKEEWVFIEEHLQNNGVHVDQIDDRKSFLRWRLENDLDHWDVWIHSRQHEFKPNTNVTMVLMG